MQGGGFYAQTFTHMHNMYMYEWEQSIFWTGRRGGGPTAGAVRRDW